MSSPVRPSVVVCRL